MIRVRQLLHTKIFWWFIAFDFALVISVFIFLWPKFQGSDAVETVHHWHIQTRCVDLKVTAVGDSLQISNALQGTEEWLTAFQERFRSGSTLDSAVWSAQTGDTIILDPEAYALFSFALRFRDFSGGDIDVGVGNLIRAWKIGWRTDSSQVPSDSLRLALVEDLKTPFYSLDSTRNGMIIHKGLHHFALGAFLEGFILDAVASRVKAGGAKSFLIDVSGDFAFEGTKPGNLPWVLGVKDPENPEELLASVTMQPDKMSFCTSGDYEQKFTDAKGKKHHHILNPHTGESTVGKHSASVTTSIPWMNKNTLCTWFMILPLEQIKKVVAESQGQIETMIVLDSSQVWISPGLRNNVSILKDNYTLLP